MRITISVNKHKRCNENDMFKESLKLSGFFLFNDGHNKSLNLELRSHNFSVKTVDRTLFTEHVISTRIGQ